MARSLRSNARKHNNQKLKRDIFGPVELERAERLSAKMTEIANQPIPKPDAEMKTDDLASDGMLKLGCHRRLQSSFVFAVLTFAS